MILNRERLAEMLGCSLRTVDEYRRQGMPGEAPKRHGDQWRFDSSAVVTWLRDKERESALGDVAEIDEFEAKRRKLAAEASLAELALALKQGAAVAISDFEAAWSAMIGAARAKLLGLPAALGPEVALIADPFECAAVIESAVKEALAELSDATGIQVESESDELAAGRDEEGGPPVEPSPGPDRKRMGRRGKTA